jgi:hypothetical protein
MPRPAATRGLRHPRPGICLLGERGQSSNKVTRSSRAGRRAEPRCAARPGPYTGQVKAERVALVPRCAECEAAWLPADGSAGPLTSRTMRCAEREFGAERRPDRPERPLYRVVGIAAQRGSRAASPSSPSVSSGRPGTGRPAPQFQRVAMEKRSCPCPSCVTFSQPVAVLWAVRRILGDG